MAEEKPTETLEDYLARLNIEGQRDTWVKNRRKIDLVLSKAARYLTGRKTACDIGIGEGYMLRSLVRRGLEVTGVDVSRYLIEYFNNRFKKDQLCVELIRGDMSCIDLGQDHFDIVTCLDVLEHIPGAGLTRAIRSVEKCLVNKGVFIGTLPLGENLDKNMVMCPKCRHEFHRIGHCHSFPDIQAVKKLLGPSFRIVKYAFVPFEIFRFKPLNILANRLYSLACIVTGLRQPRTVYFIAELNKGPNA